MIFLCPLYVRPLTGLGRRGVSYSVGIVGRGEHFAALAELRARLRPEVHLRVNAYRDEGPGYYGPDDLARLRALDPLFEVSDGEVRRCHVVPARIGDLYAPDFDAAPTPRPGHAPHTEFSPDSPAPSGERGRRGLRDDSPEAIAYWIVPHPPCEPAPAEGPHAAQRLRPVSLRAA